MPEQVKECSKSAESAHELHCGRESISPEIAQEEFGAGSANRPKLGETDVPCTSCTKQPLTTDKQEKGSQNLQGHAFNPCSSKKEGHASKTEQQA